MEVFKGVWEDEAERKCSKVSEKDEAAPEQRNEIECQDQARVLVSPRAACAKTFD